MKGTEGKPSAPDEVPVTDIFPPPSPPQPPPQKKRCEELVARQQAPAGTLGRAHSEALSRELSPAMSRTIALQRPRPW